LLGIGIIVIIAGMRLRERLVVPEVITPPPLLVKTVRTTAEPFIVTSRYSGSVEAEKRATLSSRLASTVKNRYVREGDAVEQGQLLIRLDDIEKLQELSRLKASADRIRADLAYWQGQLAIDRRLHGKGSISEQKLQESVRQAASLSASLEENRHAQATVKTYLSYAEVVAPFSGVVQSVLVETGETVNPGSPLLEFVDTQSLKAVIRAPQVDLQRLSPGQRVYLKLHQIALVWPGEIARIYPALDSHSRNLTLEVPFHHDDQVLVQAGMSVEAEVELQQFDSVITVPLHAVQQRKGEDGVFVVREGRAEWLPVSIGIIQDDRAQLIRGISVGELVITTPYPALEAGSAVELYEEGELNSDPSPTV
jgi:RND family efflux transporter MFP subunit